MASAAATRLIMHQPVPLPTPRGVAALLLELTSGDPGTAKVRLTAEDGEQIEVTWTSGEEIKALGNRLYLQIWRDASVYVLP